MKVSFNAETSWQFTPYSFKR